VNRFALVVVVVALVAALGAGLAPEPASAATPPPFYVYGYFNDQSLGGNQMWGYVRDGVYYKWDQTNGNVYRSVAGSSNWEFLRTNGAGANGVQKITQAMLAEGVPVGNNGTYNYPQGATGNAMAKLRAIDTTTGTAAEQAAKKDVLARFGAMWEKAKLIPARTSLGTVQLGAAAAYIGWKIGSGVNAKWLHIGVGSWSSPPAGVFNGLTLSNVRLSPCSPTPAPGNCGSYTDSNPTCCAAHPVPYEEGSWVTNWHWSYQFGSGDTSSFMDPQSTSTDCATPENLPPNVGATKKKGTPYNRNTPWNPCTDNVTPAAWVVGADSGSAPKLAGAPEPYTNQQVDVATPFPTAPSQLQFDSDTAAIVADPKNTNAIQWGLNATNEPGEGDADLPSPGDPTVETRTVPSCVGLGFVACAAALEGAGFMNHPRTTLTIDDAQLDKGAGEVVTLDPAAGRDVAPSTPISVTTNPDVMPHVMPDIRGKKRTEAAQMLSDAGFPETEPTVRTSPDLSYGPDVVTNQSPDPGTRVDTSTSPEVVVTVNPLDAPTPGGETGQDTSGATSGCGLPQPSSQVNLDPIKNANLGDKFPMNVPGWILGSVGGLVTTSERPNATFTVFGQSADLGFLESFDGAIGLWRLILTFFLWIGVGWFLWDRTLGRA